MMTVAEMLQARRCDDSDISAGYHQVTWDSPRHLAQLQAMPGYAEAVRRIEVHIQAGHEVTHAFFEVANGRIRRVDGVRQAPTRQRVFGEVLPSEDIPAGGRRTREY